MFSRGIVFSFEIYTLSSLVSVFLGLTFMTETSNR
jgi:hypothetical protein